MADAAEEVAGLAEHALRLKWPNDMVIEDDEAPETAAEPRGAGAGEPTPGAPAGEAGPGYRKLAGVLGETSGLGTASPTVIVGIGINADWPAAEFPSDLAPGLTSLREASHGRPIDMAALLDGFLGRLEVRTEALRMGRFDVTDWLARQLVVGRLVRLERPDGSDEVVRALGVDARTGGLLVADPTAANGERLVLGGEIRHLRLAAGPTAPGPEPGESGPQSGPEPAPQPGPEPAPQPSPESGPTTAGEPGSRAAV
jgi:biotin-(acetyl-CoA carboxylase) ligase